MVNEKYNEMDNIRKIGLRQLFFYGKYILKKIKHKKDNEIMDWYENILDKIRYKNEMININAM